LTFEDTCYCAMGNLWWFSMGSSY